MSKPDKPRTIADMEPIQLIADGLTPSNPAGTKILVDEILRLRTLRDALVKAYNTGLGAPGDNDPYRATVRGLLESCGFVVNNDFVAGKLLKSTRDLREKT